MEKKEVKKWQGEEALKRYQMIAPLLGRRWRKGKDGSCGRKPRKRTAYPKGRCTVMKKVTVKKVLTACGRRAGRKEDSRGSRKTLMRSWDRRYS